MKSFDRLVSALRRLPGIGPRQAERLAVYAIRASEPEIRELSSALTAVKSSVRLCLQCCNYTENELCPVCSDLGRDKSLICVVEDPQDLAAVEKTGSFNGLYHVLHGTISPMDGRSESSIKLRELKERIMRAGGSVSEVIIATNPDTEGETTALYLSEALKELVPKITRIAYGVPLGGDLDYTDEMTLGYALKGRTKI
ncbi:MAG: recombination mediator RecR [bacterium]